MVSIDAAIHALRQWWRRPVEGCVDAAVGDFLQIRESSEQAGRMIPGQANIAGGGW